jgi:transposase
MLPTKNDSPSNDSAADLVASLLARIDGLVAQIAARDERIGELVAQNKALLARIAELEAKLGGPPKTPDNSSVPPSRGQKANTAPPKSKQKRKGRPGVTRQLAENPDATRRFYAEHCACGAALSKDGQELAKQYDHIDIPPVRPVTTRIELFRAACPCCKARVTANAPADMPEGMPFGPEVASMIAYLHGCQMIGFKRLTEVCEGLFGLTISQGAIANMLARVGEAIAAPAERIATEVRASEVIASDETSARVKGKTWWQWTFGCATAVYHVIAPTRGKCVPTDFLGGVTPKMWLSDRLAAQLGHAEEHQFCLAHLIRDGGMPSTTATRSSRPASRRCSRTHVRSAAAGPISPTPPSPRTAAVSKGDWSSCSHSGRPMPRAASCETRCMSTAPTSCSCSSSAATPSRPTTKASGH